MTSSLTTGKSRTSEFFKGRLIEAGALMSFCFVLLLPYFSGHWRLADDAYLFATPFFTLFERILKQGEWPLWNLNTGLGQPWALSAGAETFFPLQILWSLLIGWSEKSYLFYLLFLLSSGAWLSVRFAERAGLSKAAAWFFALAFVGNGYVLGLLSNPALIIPYLFWPLLGDGLIELQEKSGDVPAAARKIALALLFIETSGYPLTKLEIYAATAVVYLGLCWGRVRWRPLLLATFAAILATCPEWLLRFGALGLSERMGSDIYSDTSYGSPSNFLSLGSAVLPGLFLKRDQFQLGMVWLERSWWVGAVTLAMVAAGVVTRSVKFSRFKVPALVALAGFLFAMGGHSFLRELAAVILPMLEHIRFANNARLLPMAFVAFLAAASLSGIEGRFPEGGKPAGTRGVMKLWSLFFLACAMAALSESENGIRSADLYADASAGWKIGSLHSFFYILLAYTAFQFRWTLTRSARWPMLVVLFQALSLADTAYAFRKLVAVEARTPLAGAETFRPESPQRNERSLKAWGDTNDWIDWAGNKKVLNAYNPPYHRWLKEAQNAPALKPLLGRLVSCQDRGQEVLGHELGGGNALSCAGQTFVIDRYFGNRIEIHGSGAAPALVVVHDFFDPHWQAILDGKEVPVLRAFGYFKAVEVPGGREWRLKLEYVHPELVWAWIACAFGVLLMGGFPWLFKRMRLTPKYSSRPGR